MLILQRLEFGRKNMASGYINYDLIIAAARDAIRPKLIVTMALTLTGSIMIAGLCNIGGHQPLLLQIAGLVLNILWLLFGLTALAHQIHAIMQDEHVPTMRTALRFARRRLRAIVMLPLWIAGAFLLLIGAELLLLWLANLPGPGLLWLAVLTVPLVLLNTVVVLAMLLALFNLAARVAMSDVSAEDVRRKLWQMMQQRLPELLIYNLGGILITLIVMALIFSPIWVGGQMTLELMAFSAPGQLHQILHPAGFWSGMAYMTGLMLCGLLVAAIASIPCIVITHVTVAIHRALDVLLVAEAKRHSGAASERGGEEHA